MTGTIAITDYEWYRFLAAHPDVAELNFWKPSARQGFRAEPFSPFLFKLKSPRNAICGFAYFAQFTRLPDWLAWDTFEFGNGCASLAELRARIGGIRKGFGYDPRTGSDEIGCIQLIYPTFFPEEAWIPQPSDWLGPTQTHKGYDLAVGEGRRVWEACLAQAAALGVAVAGEFAATRPEGATGIADGPRYGDPRLARQRLGQGTFRIAVLDAYGRACAVTGEHSLPALEAAHIRAYEHDGPHDTRNGLLLRADLHRLFDTGYVTVTPDLHLEVSERLRSEYKNGHSYYPHHGKLVNAPNAAKHRPDPAFLAWHNEHVFRG